RQALRFLLNRCNVVTAVSGDLLAREGSWLDIVTSQLVTYPAARVPRDAPKSGSLPKTPSGASPDPLVLVVCPLHYGEKVAGVLDAIRAMPIVAEQFPRTALVVAGDGRLRPSVERLVESLGLSSSVHLIGNVPDPWEAVSAADVVCHPSYRDELPHAVLEAMARAKPLACVPVGGIPEVARDEVEAIYLVPSPDGIAAGLLRLLRDATLRDTLGAAARSRISTAWTPGNTADACLRAYAAPSPKRIHVSVDVEEDHGLPDPSYRGVEEAVPRLLDILRAADVDGSFFITADVARRYPDLVARIAREGHHVGSHGLSHHDPPFAGRPLGAQRRDVQASLEALHEVLSRPISFRAPNFLVDVNTIAALREASVAVDSSVVPGRRVRRTRRSPPIDFRGAPADPYRMSATSPLRVGGDGLLEVPVASNPFAAGSPVGLGYLNLAGVDRVLDAVARAAASRVVFLVHPWEALDYPSDASIPGWMRQGCRSDLRPLEGFLRRASSMHRVVAFSDILDPAIETNGRVVPSRGIDGDSSHGPSRVPWAPTPSNEL
ncbi:MAG: glycosyltransferase, partial [Methanobacteriota archaeon]